MLSMTLMELAQKAGMSSSHIGRIERGERFPSARILRKLACPLGFQEVELLTMADYMTSPESVTSVVNHLERIDPYVVTVLSQEPMEFQRLVVSIFTLMKNLSNSLVKDECSVDKVLTDGISSK